MLKGPFNSTWRKRFRNTLLLGTKPAGNSGANIHSANSITLVKRDNIGDFILATTFLNEAYVNWKNKKITFVCNPQLQGMARALYPEWNIKAPVETTNDYKPGLFRKRPLKRRLDTWPADAVMLSLRAMRRPNEIIFDSWVPAGYKIAIRNQYERFEPGLLSPFPSEQIVYNEIIDADKSATDPEVCQDINNYRELLNYCFPDRKSANLRAMPRLPESPAWNLHTCAMPKAALPILAQKYLAVFPFPSYKIREYPAGKMACAITEIANRHGLAVVILGGPDNSSDAGQMLELLKTHGDKISLAGKLTLEESLACIARAAGMLSVESFGAHAAVAAGVPTVAILGGGHYGQFAPWGQRSKVRWLSHNLSCFGCSWLCNQEQTYCIKNIEPESIGAAFEQIMKPELNAEKQPCSRSLPQ